jgi:hypothetical protein
MRWAGNLASMGKARNAYKILSGKPAGKRCTGVHVRAILGYIIRK